MKAHIHDRDCWNHRTEPNSTVVTSGKGRLIELVQASRTAWSKSAIWIRSSIVYVLSLALFLFLYFFCDGPLALVLRAIAGLMTFIVLPGAFIASLFLPNRMHNLVYTLLVGLMLVMIECQVMFTITLLTQVHIPLVTALAFMNCLVAGASILAQKQGNRPDPLSAPLIIPGDRQVHTILIGAAVVRILLLVLVTNAIAPDAALYADYARRVVDGYFNSSVVNDSRVYDLWNGVQYCHHQGFIYLFAVSWLLVPPSGSGPTLVLPIAGLLVVMLGYLITERFFGAMAAKWISIILAFHPTFVFHSVVAYGPEITSLIFMVGALLVIIESKQEDTSLLILGGIMLGLVDVIWYANFLLVCILLPILLIALKLLSKTQFVAMSSVMAIILVARLFASDLAIFALSWLAVLSIASFLLLHRPDGEYKGIAAVAASVGLIQIFWRGVVHVPQSMAGAVLITGIPPIAATQPLSLMLSQSINIMVFLANITPEITARFVLFVVFHTTPVLFCLVPYALLKGNKREVIVAFLLAASIACFGTLKLFSNFALYKDPLREIYLFSDSRFFLSIVFLIITALGGYFSRVSPLLGSGTRPFLGGRRWLIMDRKGILALLILLGFVPGFLMIPGGFALIQFEQRYEWDGLRESVLDIGDADSLFLVDRATEFSWMTGRLSAHMILTRSGLASNAALANLGLQMEELGCNYLVVDAFTIARWDTLHGLLNVPISMGSVMIAEGSVLTRLADLSVIEQVSALTLLAETRGPDSSVRARIFATVSANFSRVFLANTLDTGWSAGNGGTIISAQGNNELIVSTNELSTYTFRTDGFDLGISVTGGFLISKIVENAATVDRVEVLDDGGELIAQAERISDYFYFALLGDVNVGDIRVYCNGTEGQSVIVSYHTIWGFKS